MHMEMYMYIIEDAQSAETAALHGLQAFADRPVHSQICRKNGWKTPKKYRKTLQKSSERSVRTLRTLWCADPENRLKIDFLSTL